MRILAVDDEIEILESYQKILGKEKDEDILSVLQTGLDKLYDEFGDQQKNKPFELTTCERGNEALEQVELSLKENRPYSVAFLDIRMPGVDGAQVARKLHKLDPCLNIVIVTGYSDVSPKQLSLDFTTPARLYYIQKPFNWQEIYQLAFALSENWKMQKELRGFYDVMEEELGSQSTELKHAYKHFHKVLAGINAFQEELSLKTQHVEEVNTRLQSQLKEKERASKDMQVCIAEDIDRHIAPLLSELNNSALSDHQKNIVSAIQGKLTTIQSLLSSEPEENQNINYSMR